MVAVTAPPVDGRATEAALTALAEALGVPRRTVRLVTGASSRTKVVEVEQPPGGMDSRVAELLDG